MSTYIIVEDEPSLYEILLAMFATWGIDGQAFTDGESAMQWIEDVDSGRYRGEIPELALIDIRLPGRISGPAVGERLRNSPTLHDIVIVLTTAYRLNPREEREMRAQCSADDLINKPLPAYQALKARLAKLTAARTARLEAARAQQASAADLPTNSSATGPAQQPAGMRGPGALQQPTPPDTLPETPADEGGPSAATQPSAPPGDSDTAPVPPMPPPRGLPPA